MSRKGIRRSFQVSLILAALAAIALPVYAHCGKCLGDAKTFAGELTKSKMTLAAASTLAEVNTKGTAVSAAVHRHEDKLIVEVHCLVEGKIMAVEVELQSGKMGKAKEVKDLEGHAGG